MKAAHLKKKGGEESLVMGEIPRPEPKHGEVLVKVHAAAITPTEFLWEPTFATRAGAPRPFPVVLGHEFSGVVETVAPGAEGFRAGDEVHGLNDWFVNGAQAEYCAAPVSMLARKPRSVDHAYASVVPISALTAWQGLFERAALQKGQRVLIHGGSGGVGVFAVQLARSRGAHVIATASARNLDFVRSLGADEVIDHRATRFEDAVRDVDVVFDTVGGETLERSWSVLARDGKLVTIATSSGASKDARVRDTFFIVRSDGAQLAEIGRLIDAGKLRAFVEEVFPLASARAAYARAQQGGMRGKVVLRVVDDDGAT